MALRVELPLPGLDNESFSSFSSYGHIIDIAGQSSPSPSLSSEYASSESSGIGSLGSLKSESLNSDSLPSSPQTTDKKLFGHVIQPQPRPKETYEDIKIIYQGRDILDLWANLNDRRWKYQATVLPPNNPALFFANRSQYHRLGTYGTRTQYVTNTCRFCGFNSVVAATD